MNNEETLSERGRLTIMRLEQALERLLNGVPELTPHDGRLNLSRINQEAGLSSGGIYYYDEFVKKAKRAINERKLDHTVSTIASGKASVDKMRAQRDRERELKERYKSQRDDIKAFCDKIIAKNAQLEFSLFEAFDKIDALEKEVSALKIVDISTRRS
ncbi:hypothetical protein RIL63_000852 [Escherichia coli]|nr:hypothetical protein [Escherichia coli]EFF0641045.1 hypothetical protein [Escherichia coli]EFH9411508.1 hypothetical protein [Escherichia coli]EFL7413202.1 hypothetical protein [Escherichia coli]EFL9452424.1 hypothetical protein [Escherichia coli]